VNASKTSLSIALETLLPVFFRILTASSIRRNGEKEEKNRKKEKIIEEVKENLRGREERLWRN
jgi:hypothetical protein